MLTRVSLFVLTLLLWAGVIGCHALDLSDPDNKHNLSNLSNNTVKAQPVATGGTDQICIFCHTPHSATPDSPLWSRPDPATATFPLYNSPLVIAGTINAGDPAGQVTRSGYTNADPAAYPNGASRLCLSCHDGVTAIGLLRDNTTINMLGGTTLNDFGLSNRPTYDPVIDLSTSHPISFTYDSNVLADLDAHYGSGAYILPSTADAVDTPLDGHQRMQCTTCHDPHNDTRAAVGIPFWRQTSVVFVDEYDDVCNACHVNPPTGFTSGTPGGEHY